ncbi:hypothetical protein [Micromonospora sp. CPCC 205561]|uniref:hypothetical protein n=1 Tax=Micromonospora sp. CPCC 205561 TaxID=3122407 RepID=UPI002FEF7CC0
MNPYQSATNHLNSLVDRTGGSEFGGVDGDPQPYPHEPTASERLRAIYQTDPIDHLAHVDTDQQAPSPHGSY